MRLGWLGRMFKAQRPPPGKETYKPRLARGDVPSDPVPEKHRRLRLRRRRVSKMQPTPIIIQMAIVAAIVGFVLMLWKVFSVPA